VKILVDIGHPAHVHFFRHPIRLLQQHGHTVLVTSRDKEIALQLLDELGIHHIPISRQGRGGTLSLAREFVRREYQLYKIVKRYKPSLLTGIGGIFVAHIGRLLGLPSLVFYDTENATAQNALTYPFASRVVVPRCYQGWVPRRRHRRYDGYHELSYLHPDYFRPNRAVAEKNGLLAGHRNFLVRTVSWQASHDIGEHGWSAALLERIVSTLSKAGKVMVSAEGSLPRDLAPYAYPGDITKLHHVMAFCSGFIGESATMASECAVLGVPAVLAARVGRGYTDEQEARYGLLRNVRDVSWRALYPNLQWLLEVSAETIRSARQKLLDESIDVAAFVAQSIEQFPKLPNGSHQPSVD